MVAVVLDLPNGQRTQRRGARRFSGAQIEAGVMPRAADTLADHQSLRQWPVIMAAMRVDGEDIRPRAHQQNVFAADMAEQGFAVEFGQLDTQRQIRSGRWGLFIGHNFPLLIENFLVRSDDDRIPARQLTGCKSPSIGHPQVYLD